MLKFTTQKSRNQRNCFYCKNENHSQEDCSIPIQKRKICRNFNENGCLRQLCWFQHICSYCRSSDHSKKNCVPIDQCKYCHVKHTVKYCEGYHLKELERQMRDAQGYIEKYSSLEGITLIADITTGPLRRNIRALAWAKQVIGEKEEREKKMDHMRIGCHCSPKEITILYGFVQCQCDKSFQ